MAQSLSKESFSLISTVALVPGILLPKGQKQPVELVKTCDFSEWDAFCAPLTALLPTISPLESRGNRPLEFTFYHQIYTLVYFHLEEYSSGRALLEDINDPKESPPEGRMDLVEVLSLKQFIVEDWNKCLKYSSVCRKKLPKQWARNMRNWALYLLLMVVS